MARIVLDLGPDGGARLARALRDAGHEVVLAAGTDATTLAGVAVQEDADLVIASGDRPGRLEEVVAALADRGAADVPAYVADPADVAGTVARVSSGDLG